MFQDRYFSNPSLSRLAETYKRVDEEFRGVQRNWNQLIRNHLSKTMGVSLSDGDDRFQITINIKASYDESFFDIIEKNYPELDFEEYFALNQLLKSAAKSERYFEEKKARHHLDMAIDYARYRLKDFDILTITNDIFRFLEPSNKDVFGCYFINDARVELYIFPIVLFCQLHGLNLESFIVMVLTHELAHAYNHIGRDKDGEYWVDFGRTDEFLAEGLAQYYTSHFIDKYYFKQPKLMESFNHTLKYQPPAYNCFRDWNTSPEVVYRAFIETRRNSFDRYDTFLSVLENAKGRI